MPNLTQDQNISSTGTPTIDSPEVQAETQKYPGLSSDVALGNVLMQEDRATKARSVLTSEHARTQTKYNKEQLQEILNRMAMKAEETASPKSKAKAEAANSSTTTTSDPYAQQLADATAALESSVASSTAQIQQYAQTLNEQAQAQVNNIQEIYARRKDQMALVNQNTLAAQTKIGVRSGRQRYAQEIQTSILSAEESAGIARLADLDNEEQQLILEAQRANTAKQFELLDKKTSLLTSVQEKKIQLIKDQSTMALQQEQLAMQKAQDKREQSKFEMEQELNTIDSITSTVFNALTGDEATDVQTIQNIADQYGVDPNVLLGSVQEHDLAFQKNALDVSAKFQSIANGIPEGGSWTDPSSGMVFHGTKSPEEIDVTQTVGSTEYKVRYKEVNGELQEQWRIELGPRWKGGTGSGKSSETTSGDAMNETITYLSGLELSDEEMASEIEWAAEQLASEYETDPIVTANTIASRLQKFSMTDEEVEQSLETGEDGVTSILGRVSDWFSTKVLLENPERVAQNRAIKERFSKRKSQS